MKRIIDFCLALILFSLSFLPMLLIAFTVKLTSEGEILFWSDRVGKNGKIFRMPKYRSMKMDTPTVATHLLSNPSNALTPIGGFLRQTSLDELPQLWCILKGEMSFVGPRPALSTQDDLIKLRKETGVSQLKPGLTGWAQINGRDNLSVPQKVAFDVEYMKRQSLSFDAYILFRTIFKVLSRNGIAH